jgi:hypothetical protein
MLSAVSLRIAPLALGVLLATAPAGTFATPSPAPAPIRIGTFDSRCVALAYYRSPAVMKELAGMRGELQKAKEAGNETKVQELQARGPAMQMLMHQQVFSNGSVGNILPAITTQLQDVAKAAGVVAIVSKWEVPQVGSGVELVDLTPQIVALLAPDAATMTMIGQMKNQQPLPLVDALAIKD